MAMNFNEDFQRPESGIGHPGMDAPFGVYPTADGWVTVAMSPFKRLIEVLDANELLQYDDPQRLFDQRDEVWEKLAAITKTWTSKDLITVMLAADIWCGEVKTHLQAAADPQVEHMGCIDRYEHPTAGSVKVVGPTVKMSRTPATIERPAPRVGEHTLTILRESGFSAQEIEEMLDRRSVAQLSESSG